ncbi:hypothetical protein SKAU_G00171870 [Synaphobranchus kaupii]|uniref:Uncharacterized protein n=1 Tax=Synaphobranchus kaupii TaxID=118154 RepID=A0A9Q1J0X9_SYNKA|nr:hypothetical protein SKAU_G00171870 [Synaphobranchus kaupii]
MFRRNQRNEADVESMNPKSNRPLSLEVVPWSSPSPSGHYRAALPVIRSAVYSEQD